MLVEAQVTIDGSRAAIWAAITDIEHAATIISGIEKIEIVDRPAHGLVGLRWRETRMLFGKPATVEKWITDATENEFYRTRAEDDGTVYVTTKSVSERSGGMTLTEVHESLPQGAGARALLFVMGFLLRGVARKYLMRDLNDIKVMVEARHRQVAG